jgi:hypothetical protein
LLEVSTLDGHRGGVVAPRLPSLHELPTLRPPGRPFAVAAWVDGPSYTVQRADLARIVTAMGGLPGGMNAAQRLAARQLLGDALGAVAERCSNPQAARHAAQALAQPPWVSVHVTARAGSLQTLAAQLASEAGQAAAPSTAAAQHLSQLPIGAHLNIPWMQASDQHSGHAMVLGVTRVSEGEARITAVNSVSFSGFGDVSHSKTVSLAEAARLLDGLRDGRLPAKPPYLPAPAWSEPAAGAVLLQALHETAPGRPVDTPPAEASTVPQKQPSDCGVESQLAWLSTVLPSADYKLAKAAMLHAVGELADALAADAEPAERALLERAHARLAERQTSSLSGSLIAPA